MARGRQQTWFCKECKSSFSVQNTVPKFCCNCGSQNIGRAPSYELMITFGEKEKELEEICEELNVVYGNYTAIKSQYDAVMSYWKQQKRRGYISAEEYQQLAAKFIGYQSK